MKDAASEARFLSWLNFSNLKDYLALIVAFLFLIAFVIFTIYLLGLRYEQEIQWTRAVYLFNGTEAIAFAAAGFFFGSVVQQKRLDQAEKRMRESEKVAVNAAIETIKEVTKGRSLNEMLQSKLQERANTREISKNHDGLHEEEKGRSHEDLREIANLVSRLFSEHQVE